jgi:hypothetical protein
MTRKERLQATLKGDSVDRPAVNFYEVGGFAVDPLNPDPYNIYNSPSWRELLTLAEEKTDIIRMRSPLQVKKNPLYDDFFKTRVYEEGHSRFSETTLTIGKRTMSSLTRRDREVDTVWTIKHLLKDEEDLKAYLTLPNEIFDAEYAYGNLFEAEEQTGEKGIVMSDTGDPLCMAADLFDFGTYTILALTEQSLFHQLLEKLSPSIHKKTEDTAREFPGRLWRVVGPEYASEPYLPPSLFKDYVNRYTGPMVKIIQKHGGLVRLHSHGRLKNVLPHIVAMGVDGLDPIEPPSQGDMELEDVVKEYGQDLVLFGNVEITDIENMEPGEFEKKTARSIEAGIMAKGFVLMPSASPYGREVSPRTFENYRTMIRLVS